MKAERKEELIGMLGSCCLKDTPLNYFKKLREKGRELQSLVKFLNLANFGSAISSRERLILLTALNEQDLCVCELEIILHKSQSTVSHHLRKLERAKLIKSYKKGNYTYYHLEKEKLREFIDFLTATFFEKWKSF
ncbi:MAG: ArsR/SmtB family transcription factor [Promethearchaeota archaeon]